MSAGVKFPFTIQGGSVAMTDNPTEIAGSRIVFCLGTMIGERIMRPNWGVDIINTVHSVGGDLDLAIKEAVQNAFLAWFPEYEAREVSLTRNQENPTYVEVEVRFGRYDSELDESIRVGTQLPNGTEIYTNEGF
jgi:phage baseplate assembly protein W